VVSNNKRDSHSHAPFAAKGPSEYDSRDPNGYNEENDQAVLDISPPAPSRKALIAIIQKEVMYLRRRFATPIAVYIS